MLFRTQIIFCSSELRLHFRIAEVGSLLSLNRAWRAQVTLNRCERILSEGQLFQNWGISPGNRYKSHQIIGDAP